MSCHIDFCVCPDLALAGLQLALYSWNLLCAVVVQIQPDTVYHERDTLGSGAGKLWISK